MFFAISSTSALSRRHSPTGFVLRKFIVVAGIIILLGLMIVPSLMNARFEENENSVKGSLRAIYEANELYRKTHRPAEYPELLSLLAETAPPLVDAKIVLSAQKGYQLKYERPSGNEFSVAAEPIYKFLTGYHVFYVDETGIIRLNNAKGDPIDA